ncbi:hypothetical protein KGF54_000026 [Candida jiufengensis]|uniref:uncharacterized protein n=1 Tax=Candida jiufengensis TaxID=497108 RepID=UPI0022246827|nr:uncharacterized protein KGF54_000026 [Candida jiufengensis]KAI5957098.1 hypothetical protein KGF54_000026 [Candida jiufengensis]
MNIVTRVGRINFTHLLIYFIAILLPWISVSGSNHLRNLFKFDNKLDHDFNSGPLSYHLQKELTFKIPVHIYYNNENFELPDLIEATQIQINNELRNLINNHENKNLLKIELFDCLKYNCTNNETEYKLDLILNRENSLGVSSDELKAIVFYSLDSIHSNDLPFLITQTILHHFLYGDIELINRKLIKEDFDDEVYFKMVFAGPAFEMEDIKDGALFVSEVMSNIEGSSEQINCLTKLAWDILPQGSSLTDADYTDVDEDKSENKVIIIFPNKLSKVLKISNFIEEKDQLISKILSIIEKQLGLPSKPSNNFNIKLNASLRWKILNTLSKVSRRMEMRNNESENKAEALLAKEYVDHFKSIIQEINNNYETHSLINQLNKSKNLLYTLE